MLARAIQGRPVVLGYYFSRHAGAHRIGHLPGAVFDGNLFDGTLLPQWDGFGANLDRLGEAARSSGFYNAQLDRDGVVRSVPVLTLFNGQMYESLALAILRVYEDNPPITLNGHVLSLSGQTRLTAGPPTSRHAYPLPGGAGPHAAASNTSRPPMSSRDGSIRPASVTASCWWGPRHPVSATVTLHRSASTLPVSRCRPR